MSFYAWKPYVPVAKRREQAAKKLAKLQKKGAHISPIVIQGRTIAASFWGKSWCDNLERYSDYATRLPRGRSYVRNGSVLDLQIAKGEITAKVNGSELYTIKITIAPVAAAGWKSICGACAGSIDSVVELLQGRLAKGVMDRVCRQGDGLFPGPKEIKLSCSCPDWADMCKHVAAALYGVGARLDQQPELLFLLRGVDAKDMIASAGAQLAAPMLTSGKGKVLADDDMAALFGLDMADAAVSSQAPTAPVGKNPPAHTKPTLKTKPLAAKVKKHQPAATKPAAARGKAGAKRPRAGRKARSGNSRAGYRSGSKASTAA